MNEYILAFKTVHGYKLVLPCGSSEGRKLGIKILFSSKMIKDSCMYAQVKFRLFPTMLKKTIKLKFTMQQNVRKQLNTLRCL